MNIDPSTITYSLKIDHDFDQHDDDIFMPHGLAKKSLNNKQNDPKDWQ